MLALVLAGGDLMPSEWLLREVRAAELVVAADSGLRHAGTLGVTVRLLVGDLDSILLPLSPDYEVVRFPAAKDQTDTHLAIRESRRRGADRVLVVAALRGDRLDHGAANLLLPGAREFRGFDLRLADGLDELRAVDEAAELTGHPGDLVSLMPLARLCRGVITSGLRYPLQGETLALGTTRGVSNELVGTEARVSLRSGTLLLVHRHGVDPNRLAPV